MKVSDNNPPKSLARDTNCGPSGPVLWMPPTTGQPRVLEDGARNSTAFGEATRRVVGEHKGKWIIMRAQLYATCRVAHVHHVFGMAAAHSYRGFDDWY